MDEFVVECRYNRDDTEWYIYADGRFLARVRTSAQMYALNYKARTWRVRNVTTGKTVWEYNPMRSI